MAPSQLKRLKASLREQGIVGPQKSKKQKKQNQLDGDKQEKRITRTNALSSIREQFNPFEVKTSARGPKYDVTSNKTLSGRVSKGIKGRPGVTKGLGEENRKKTLLVEMQRRNKIGGVSDKRFGENDPTMTPQDKMLERFTRENQQRHKSSIFDLEEDDQEGGLTHLGQSLSLDGPDLVDDYEEEDLRLSDAEDHPSDEENPRKRRRNRDSEVSDENNDLEDDQGRKKSKQEVMKEVIAKSKLYKHERQAAKEDDIDLREELDLDVSGIQALLNGPGARIPAPKIADNFGMNPERAALLAGISRDKLEKVYDTSVRQLASDKRSKPTERSKTEEEKKAEESRRLKDLEAQRLRRMNGDSDDDEDQQESKVKSADLDDRDVDDTSDNLEFGLGSGIKSLVARKKLGVEEEDDFIIDKDLVDSQSDLDSSEDEESQSEVDDDDDDSDEDNDFFDGILTEGEAERPEFLTGANAPLEEIEFPSSNGVNGNLAFTFPCPESHEQLLEITKDISNQDLPLVIRRIRALYDPGLNSENKTKLGNFAVALVEHISYLANREDAKFEIIEQVIRHVHALAMKFPVEIANEFRRHLEIIAKARPLALDAGDLMLLTAIGSIFPTSDHFHQVTTPAMLTITRYIGQNIPHTLFEYATGLYLATLSLQYQSLSKRFVPELEGYLMNTIHALAPVKLPKANGSFPYHESRVERIINSENIPLRKLRMADVRGVKLSSAEECSLKVALLGTCIDLLEAAATMWADSSAFNEIFSPISTILKALDTSKTHASLPVKLNSSISSLNKHIASLLTAARLNRRPLELHHHRPLAIKMSIPRFEESFNPDKHYDPDRERAAASKLRAEHKKERKGAMRELRKDANFIARESLREKKERDAAYDKKYKRLVAEIQGEEGREAKAYEREKEWRRKGRK